MGNLLGAPITDKETHVGDGENLKFGLSSMQGWRVHMDHAQTIANRAILYETPWDKSNQQQNENMYLELFAI